jgi:hypothetical protein
VSVFVAEPSKLTCRQIAIEQLPASGIGTPAANRVNDPKDWFEKLPEVCKKLAFPKAAESLGVVPGAGALVGLVEKVKLVANAPVSLTKTAGPSMKSNSVKKAPAVLVWILSIETP